MSLKRVLQDRIDKQSQEEKENKELKRTIAGLEEVNETLVQERRARSTADSLNFKVRNRTMTDEEYNQTNTNTNIFRDHLPMTPTAPEINDLLQPEMLSIEDTIHFFREVLRRALKSIEVMRAVIEVTEIRELLSVIVHIDTRLQEEE
jgi:hypothetical protein